VLEREAQRWAALDRQAFPFLTRVAADLAHHDDREQFLTGLDLLLDGLRAQVATDDRAAPDRHPSRRS
jgi:hypothetical protein